MAHINLSETFAMAEFDGFGGINRLASVSGKGGISDLKNFRVESDRSLKKRYGFSSVIKLGGDVRAQYAVSDELVFMLVGSQILRVNPKSKTSSVEATVQSSVGDACFFNYGKALHLIDGNELYVYSDDGFVPVEGYVPLYAKELKTGTQVGEVYEPINLLSKRIRMSFSVTDDIKVYFPFTVESIDHVYYNGGPMGSNKLVMVTGNTSAALSGTYNTGDIVEVYMTLADTSDFRSELTENNRAITYGNGKGGCEDSSVAFYKASESSRLYTTKSVDFHEMERQKKIYPDISPIYVPRDGAHSIGHELGNITAACRSGSSLMVFSENSTYLLSEGDGEGEKLTCISETSGCSIKDGAMTFENSPITLSKNGILRWTPSTIYDNEYTAKCLSMPIVDLLPLSPSDGIISYHKAKNEIWFYCHGQDRVWIYNTLSELWYSFDGFTPEGLLEIGGEMSFISDGYLYMFSPELTSDNGGAIITASLSGTLKSLGDINRTRRLSRVMMRSSPSAAFELTVTDALGRERSVALSDKSGEREGYIEKRLSCPRSRYYSFSLSHARPDGLELYSLIFTAVR